MERRDFLKKYVHYSKGDLFWKERNLEDFKTFKAYRVWNSKYAFKKIESSCKRKQTRYIVLSIFGEKIYGHRAVWEMHHGRIKDGHMIDHIDGNGLNNKLENLRLVDYSGNAKNQRLSKLNKSGVTGVIWDKNTNKWKTQIQVDKKIIWLGRYSDLGDAKKARKEAENKYGFHPNHGARREAS